jgi:shikimate kinase
MKIYLCGMIGSGKTTLGLRLARELGLDFYDLDREMEAILGFSFHRLVAEKGWLAFRELEYTICKRFARLPGGIVCLGGGTVRYEWNVDVLKGTAPIVLLTASPAELIRRVRSADRPRVNTGVSLEEDVRRLWKEFAHKYHGAADAVFATDRKNVDAAVAELKRLITGGTLQQATPPGAT